VISPRTTRLFRTPDLRAFRRTIRRLAGHRDISRLRDCAVIVPSAAAADQLRRTIEDHTLRAGAPDRALALPQLVTRSGWYDLMYSRLAAPPRRLGDLEREVLLNAAAREVSGSDVGAPFRLRAGLLAEMLALYDDLRRRDVSLDSFERRLTRELERDADVDRGAARLLWQTRFLAAAFRGYESRRAGSAALDEHALRALLLESSPVRPLIHVIVTVGERASDTGGLWPADFDLLARLPGLSVVDIVATHASLAAGLFDRLEKFMPGFEEGQIPQDEDGVGSAAPVVMGPSDGEWAFQHRDREDELASIAAGLKRRAAGANLARCAVVFKRPLPYVYLARTVFEDARVPYQTFDALPLAAEPYAAALDLVFEFVTSNFTREPVVALLGSPHFAFPVDGGDLGRADIALLNRKLSEEAYFGGIDRLSSFDLRAARAAVSAAAELQSLTQRERPSVHLRALLDFLTVHERVPSHDDPLRERYLRARAAVLSAIHGLRRAHLMMDDSPVPVHDVASMLRRWIEGQTFAQRAGTSGVQLLDAQAARYGEFDQVFLVGLIEGEWPERPPKNIFYPASLLTELDWPDSRISLAGERAAFQDLLRLPHDRVSLSMFQLENDAIVGPSVFLEDLDRSGLAAEADRNRSGGRVFVYEALSIDPVAERAVEGQPAEWLALRTGRSDAAGGQFHGTAVGYQPPSYSISTLERYLQCPFRFFAERVLAIEEDPEDELTLNARDLGIFVHRVFQRFFEEWTRLGHRSVTPSTLPLARATFAEIVEPLLSQLPDGEAAVLRTRLLGSAADEGLAEAVFQIEAEWETPVAERLLEHPLEGEFEIAGPDGIRRVALRGKADRIDLLQDGTFRIIDYKLTRAPDRKLALQLPIYTVCAVQHLRKTTGRTWRPGQAGYIAFGQDRQFVPMLARGKGVDETLLEAQAKLLDALDRIERGEFPPTPADPMMCTRCAQAPVCRKDYVGDV
jgi:RecB family exonuclease